MVAYVLRPFADALKRRYSKFWVSHFGNAGDILSISKFQSVAIYLIIFRYGTVAFPWRTADFDPLEHSKHAMSRYPMAFEYENQPPLELARCPSACNCPC